MLTLRDINRALDRLGGEAFIPRTRRKRPFTPDFGSSCRSCGDPTGGAPPSSPELLRNDEARRPEQRLMIAVGEEAIRS
jgi:hypothetical protein